MIKEPSADETIVVAAYANWHDAEIARGFLENEGITSVLVGQDPHRSPESTDGVRLRILSARAEEAIELLDDAELLPQTSSPQDAKQARIAMKRLTMWTFAIIFGLILFSLIVNVF